VTHSRGPDGIFEQVAVGHSQVLVNRNGGLIGTADGNLWTTRGRSGILTVGIDYVNGQFVMFGRDNNNPAPVLALTSPDGLAWIIHEVPSTGAARRIVYGGGQYVAVGGGIFTLPTRFSGPHDLQSASTLTAWPMAMVASWLWAPKERPTLHKRAPPQGLISPGQTG
jgi:hypothetical protein